MPEQCQGGLDRSSTQIGRGVQSWMERRSLIAKTAHKTNSQRRGTAIVPDNTNDGLESMSSPWRGTTFPTTRNTALITVSTVVVRNRFFLCSVQSRGGTKADPVGPVTGKGDFTRDIVELDFDDEEYVDHADTFYAVQAFPARVYAVADRRPIRSSALRAASSGYARRVERSRWRAGWASVFQGELAPFPRL